MKIVNYLIIDSQSGQCRLRKSPTAGFGEYVLKLVLEIPDPLIDVFEIKVPVPETLVVTKAESLPFGIPWALAEGIIEVKGIEPKGQVIWDYTEAGLKRLYAEAQTPPDQGWWGLREYARQRWGLPEIYVERARWEGLFPEAESAEAVKN